MELVNHNQPGQLAPIPYFAERRTTRRAECALDITVRQRGCFAVAGATADLTPYGARLSGAGPFAHDSEMWLRLPGLESLTVRVIWSHGPTPESPSSSPCTLRSSPASCPQTAG